jgi:phosphohistidine phosphatase
MKTIHLIRHAKSSWESEHLADIDRPLNKRGIGTCQFMAPHIVDAGCRFVNVFCSPAVRAQSTIEFISLCIPETTVQWQTDENLYTFESGNLHEWCRSLDESMAELLIIGHNPALTNFCNELSNSNIGNIPTCGYVQLSSHGEGNWLEMSEMSFELTAFLRPKELMR